MAFLYYICGILIVSLVFLIVVFRVWVYVKNGDFFMHDMTDKYVPSKNNKNLSLGQVKLLKVVIFLRSTMPYIAVFLIGHRLVVLLLNGS